MSGAATAGVPLPYRRDPGCPFDPHPELGRLRREEPVSRISLAGGAPAWLITRYADARRVLADPRFSNRLTPQGVSFDLGEVDDDAAEAIAGRQPGVFMEEDPPEHTRLREMVAREFTGRRMEALRARIEALVTRQLDAMAAAGPPVDLVAAYTLAVPSAVMRMLLGIPHDTYDFARLSGIMNDFSSSADRLIPARNGLRDGMLGVIRDKRRAPGDDVLGRIVRRYGDTVSDDELAGIGNLLLVAGHETVAHMLTLGVLTLLHHPEQARLLRDGEGQVDPAIDELVRYLSVANHGEPRTATEDVQVGDVVIRKGDQVLVHLPAANRDPEQFDDPDTLDLTRPQRAHLAYGHGVHYCVGVSLAKEEMRAALPALLRRFPRLRSLTPLNEVPFRGTYATYGIESLMVAW